MQAVDGLFVLTLRVVYVVKMMRALGSLPVARVRCALRHAIGSLSSASFPVFDRRAKKMQRERASLRDDPSLYDYLRSEAAFRLADRVCDITRY